jgi:hypothetical protein
MATLTDKVSDYLIAQGIARSPRTASALPPVWRQPINGTPAPGEGTGVEVGDPTVLGLVRSGGIPAASNEAEWRYDIVDVWIRARKWTQVETTYAQIRSALIGTFAGQRRGWSMDGFPVIEAREWRALALLEATSTQGFTAQCAVLFETYAADHG